MKNKRLPKKGEIWMMSPILGDGFYGEYTCALVLITENSNSAPFGIIIDIESINPKLQQGCLLNGLLQCCDADGDNSYVECVEGI